MSNLIGYARVSTRGQDFDRQHADLLSAGVRRNDLYVDRGARASRPEFDRAIAALQAGDVLVRPDGHIAARLPASEHRSLTDYLHNASQHSQHREHALRAFGASGGAGLHDASVSRSQPFGAAARTQRPGPLNS